MIIDTINKVTSSTGTLPPVLLDLTTDTVRERNLEREQTAHNAEGYKITGQMAIEDAEAWAVGQRNGVDVGSDDVTYNNNSKYYSTVSGSIMRMAGEQAQSAATNAQYAYESAISAGESAITSGSCMRIAGESAESAEEAAVISGSYMRMAGESAEDAEAWAVGERGGDPVGIEDETYHNNSKYWSERAQEAATGIVPCGTCLFANLPSLANSNTGDMWNIEDAFTTTSDFREGAGIAVPPGANVYKTVDNKWDIMAGSTVTGVKGAAENEYRKGNVNLTPADLGLYPFSASTLSIGGYVPPSQQSERTKFFRGDGAWSDIGIGIPVPINQGGTGLTAAPTLQVNLGATGTASIFQASPRPGVQGVLPIGYGGTGATSRLAAAKALTNENVGTDAGYFVTLTSSWGKFGYSSIANAKTLLGLGDAAYLAVPIAANKGGTGATTHTSNSILAGNGTSALKHISTASGAFYATSANGAAKFGTLPIAQGGTGATATYGDFIKFVAKSSALTTVSANSSASITIDVTGPSSNYYYVALYKLQIYNGNGGNGAMNLAINSVLCDPPSGETLMKGGVKITVNLKNPINTDCKVYFQVGTTWIKG